MSKRNIQKDPSRNRHGQYRELEMSGESFAALWELVDVLISKGVVTEDELPKMVAVLQKRSAIKAGSPKT